MGLEQRVIKAFVDTLTGDTGSGGFMTYVAEVDRNDGRPNQNQNRRAEVSVISTQPQDVWLSDGTHVDMLTGSVRVDIVYPRANAWGDGNTPQNAGDIDRAMDRMDAILDNATIAATGWGLATQTLGTRGRGEAVATEARRFQMYRFHGLFGANRPIISANITIGMSTQLASRVVMGFTQQDTRPLMEMTRWSGCEAFNRLGNRSRRLTLLVAPTSATEEDVAPGTLLSDVAVTKDGTVTFTEDLRVHTVLPVTVRAGSSEIHYYEVQCVVEP